LVLDTQVEVENQEMAEEDRAVRLGPLAQVFLNLRPLTGLERRFKLLADFRDAEPMR
jgi:hypothetical protein